MTDGKMSPTNINFNFVDHDFLSTYEIKLLAGRDFLREVRADDTTAVLINETAVKNFGWTPEQAIGKRFRMGRNAGKIIGVMKDFHYRSLHTNVEPLLIALTKGIRSIRFVLRKRSYQLQLAAYNRNGVSSLLIYRLTIPFSMLTLIVSTKQINNSERLQVYSQDSRFLSDALVY